MQGQNRPPIHSFRAGFAPESGMKRAGYTPPIHSFRAGSAPQNRPQKGGLHPQNSELRGCFQPQNSPLQQPAKNPNLEGFPYPGAYRRIFDIIHTSIMTYFVIPRGGGVSYTFSKRNSIWPFLGPFCCEDQKNVHFFGPFGPFFTRWAQSAKKWPPPFRYKLM